MRPTPFVLKTNAKHFPAVKKAMIHLFLFIAYHGNYYVITKTLIKEDGGLMRELFLLEGLRKMRVGAGRVIILLAEASVIQHPVGGEVFQW